MKYTIISIDDSRKQYTDKIRSQLVDWEEVNTECVNGHDRAALDRAIKEFDVYVGSEIKVGQAGCTLSTLRAISQDSEPILVLNDDAILCENFSVEFQKRLKTVPEDCDIFTAFIPRDHDSNFYWGVELSNQNGKSRIEPTMDFYHPDGHSMFDSNGVTCRAYMRYGGVALYFTSQGKQKYLDLPHISHQTDEMAYYANYYDKMKVYTSVPYLSDLVYISGNEPSLCQETEYYMEKK